MSRFQNTNKHHPTRAGRKETSKTAKDVREKERRRSMKKWMEEKTNQEQEEEVRKDLLLSLINHTGANLISDSTTDQKEHICVCIYVCVCEHHHEEINFTKTRERERKKSDISSEICS